MTAGSQLSFSWYGVASHLWLENLLWGGEECWGNAFLASRSVQGGSWTCLAQQAVMWTIPAWSIRCEASVVLDGYGSLGQLFLEPASSAVHGERERREGAWHVYVQVHVGVGM